MISADSGLGGGGAFGDAVITLMAVIFVIFVIVLFSVVHRLRLSRRVLRAGGVDPRTLGAQIAVQMARGTALPSGMSIEQHLAELESLHTKGTISDEEYTTARAKALGN
jgi:uncharacterized membrane protein